MELRVHSLQRLTQGALSPISLALAAMFLEANESAWSAVSPTQSKNHTKLGCFDLSFLLLHPSALCSHLFRFSVNKHDDDDDDVKSL